MARKWKYDLCKRIGVCTCCESNKAEPGKTRCAKCLEKMRSYSNAYYYAVEKDKRRQRSADRRCRCVGQGRMDLPT